MSTLYLSVASNKNTIPIKTAPQGIINVCIFQIGTADAFLKKKKGQTHLLGDVVPVDVALTGIHLLLVEEAASVRHQQGLADVLTFCGGIKNEVRSVHEKLSVN